MSDLTLIQGDATAPWALPDNSLDSIVTDPPYGIAFMGKEWDDKSRYEPTTKAGEAARDACKLLGYEPWQAGFVAFTADWAAQAHRCLKPGAFLLAFGGTKAADLLTMGLRAAGFEILDGIEWLYLSGFPKAQDIGKMFDARAGAKREDAIKGGHMGVSQYGGDARNANAEEHYAKVPHVIGKGALSNGTAVTDLAKKWDGWKTPALKPAHEPIIVAQKPFSGTYCDNIERWGVGGVNVDGCRVPTAAVDDYGRSAKHSDGSIANTSWSTSAGGYTHREEQGTSPRGRFPANVVMSHGPDCTPDACQEGCPVKALDEQSGFLVGRGNKGTQVQGSSEGQNCYGTYGNRRVKAQHYDEGGGASRIFPRFFYEEADFVPFRYQPKPSRAERNHGLRDPGPVTQHGATLRMVENAIDESGRKGNHHPTVKPLGLIQWLQRLVTPPRGLTASPFLGSGTDAVAAMREGFRFWGMEISDEYLPIIEARVAAEQVSALAPELAPKEEAPRRAVEQALLAI